MTDWLFEFQFSAGTQYWTSSGIPVTAGGRTWATQAFHYHDIPGRQQSGIDEDRFDITLIDKRTRTLRDLFTAEPVYVQVIIREWTNSVLTERYRGFTDELTSRNTPDGHMLDFALVSPLAVTQRQQGYLLVDEFQRIYNSTDDTLAYAEQTQTGTWSGADYDG